MREVRPQREPPAAWPALLLAVVVLVVVASLLWATVSPAPTDAERLDPAVGAALIAGLLAAGAAGAWTLTAAPRRLDYRLRGRSLVVTTLLSRRTVPLAEITGAEVVPFELTTVPGAHAGWLNSHMPGYYVGIFPLSGLKRTRVAVGVRRGRGVLLRFGPGESLLLAPQDPEALVALVERRGAGAR